MQISIPRMVFWHKIEILRIQDGGQTPYWKSFFVCIGRLMRNLDRRWRITCRYRSHDQNDNFRKFKMADGCHLENSLSPYFSRELGLFQKKTHPPGGRQSIFFREGGGSYTAHFRRVYWPDSTHIPGWVVSVLSFYSGSVLILLFKMVIWVYNIILPHEGEIVIIYLPRLHSGSLQRSPRPLSWWVGGSMPLHKVSWNLALSLSVLATDFLTGIQKFKTLWT